MGVSAEHWLHNQSDHSEHLIFLDVDPSLTVIVSQDYLTVVKREGIGAWAILSHLLSIKRLG